MSPELHRLDEPPDFGPNLDDHYLQRLEVRKPEIAHLLARVSTETQYRTWLVQRVFVLNNAAVANRGTLEEIADAQKETNQLLRNMTERLSKVEETAASNAKTINEWTIKFQSPLTILGSLIGILVAGVIGALATKWIG